MGDTQNPKISIQICSYNRKDLLQKCLLALFKVDIPPSEFEVVLVDDGSTDGTAEMVAELDPPCHICYIKKEHAGLAAGRNVGIRNAQAPIILFIDDDTIAHPALVREHLETHRRYGKAIVMGWVNHVDNLDNLQTPRFTHSDISTSSFWTSNVSVPKNCLEEAGLFDEEFTEYGWEDIEMGRRLRKLGIVRKFNHKAIVFHCKPRWTASDIPALIRRAGASGRSAVIYYRKHRCLRSRLSTGIFAWRLGLDRILRGTSSLCERVISRSSSKPLSGLSLFCARWLLSFHYFEAVRTALASEVNRCEKR